MENCCCRISGGFWTIKSNEIIIFVVIPKENRQLWDFPNTVEAPIEIRKISKFYHKFDIAEIPFYQ
jgi:hypothetical protein